MAMTSSGTAVVTLPTDTQILITRTFAAPRHHVFKAITTPELIKRWWGGDRGEVTSADVDLRVGGKWRYVMTANEGFEVAFRGEYREIVPNERIVSTEIYDQTMMTNLAEYPSKEIRDTVINSGMEGGMQESFDHLEQVARSLR